MEESVPVIKRSPKEDANCLSKLFFFWTRKIYNENKKHGFDLKNLYKIKPNNKSMYLGNDLGQIWEQEIKQGKLNGTKPSLLRAILRGFFWSYFRWGIVVFIQSVVLKSIQPLILSALIVLITTGGYSIQQVVLYAGALCCITVATTFMNHHTNYGTNLIGMRIRVAVSSLIYRKILRLSQTSLGKTAAGQIVNLLSNDVARFDIVVIGLNYLWVGPIQVLVIGYLMWMQIGSSSMAGLVSMLLMTVPLQLMMGAATSKYRLEVAKRTDKRVKIMNELLAGVQVIKMYAWETPFESVVENARKDEIKYLTKTSYVRAVMASFMVFVERATLAATIVCYVALGNEIRPDLVFSLAMFFNMLQLTLAILVPLVIASGAETLVSIRRLQEFLLLEEIESANILPSEDKSIVMRNVEASWIYPTPTLKGLNINLPPGVLCAVIGPVGSGKSSFLKLLLGEMKASSGDIQLSGDVSYCSQEPWLFASTVKNNILFGQDFNRKYYHEVIKVCALKKDLQLFPNGDKTKVGDRGVSLSGGQRARINLARAIYRDSDIYLMDDPLSAVDTKVGRHLFDQCIVKFLRGKTRVLVTHQLQYLKKADTIIVFNKGRIEAQGTFHELSQSNLDLSKLLSESSENQEHAATKQNPRNSFASTGLMSTGEFSEDFSAELSQNENIENNTGYSGSTFWSYIKTFPSPFLLVFLLIFCQMLLSGADYWLTIWTNQEDLRYRSDKIVQTPQLEEIINIEVVNAEKPELFYRYVPSTYVVQNPSNVLNSSSNSISQLITVDGQEHVVMKTEFLMYIYISLVIAAIIVTIIRSTLYFFSCMVASKKLHNKMFHCLLETPMRFFDTNPAGRVLNRFSKDMGAIDELLPKSLIDVLQIFMVMSGILLMVAISNPFVIVLMIILSAIFVRVGIYYISISRSIKLIEGVAKSPVFSYVSSSIDGLTTIRATKNENILARQFDDHQDVHSAAWYLTILCSASFGLWLDLICSLFVSVVIAGFVVLDQFTNIQGSFIGLGISQSLILVGMLQYGIRQTAEVVNYLTSVERVLEYTQLEKEEPFPAIEKLKPDETWPDKGDIEFQNLYLRYVPTDPPVLKDLNFKIEASEKIGIVGRTGAGKSSLISALFRLAPTEGSIIIDGIDTSTLPLKELRKKISIIPQMPVLFSATMRYNLDPFNEFQDHEIWSALREVDLIDEINSLDFMVTGGGNNFSVGQRQLICLARALLRKNKILILDEATANVDPRTDEFIQRTIRMKFVNFTVLTIAHRLNTIMDSDKVLVMNSGRHVEFGHPHILLQNPEGYFSKMLEKLVRRCHNF
ncbi:hypothetical protein WA026_003307 [Henosepilachna vigintioctopunctata]|uniref:Uncharacterized protein n=1 Tax=Henosepilachna vigintioctopunctata TaxID=420089 RepID=A0AAW1TI83_9CUCU